MMIRLFLENHEVELDKNVQFAITKTFEDVTSPADIKNDWSKTVEIPFTQKNNKIFGMLFSTDRLIVEGNSKLMGVYFNPYKKVDFRLQWGSAIIMQGYAKNINVIKTSTGGHYNITLNGELGKVFQEMKKITFDTTTEDKTYLIDGAKYVSETINKDLVYNLWSNEPDFNDLSLLETSDNNYKVENILGFAPNNSYTEDFDYKTFQVDNTTSELFKDELDDSAKKVGDNNSTYESVVGISSETVVGNGILPRAIGEFRSYLQLPYIYFNKLFTILLEKTKELTGYDYELDKDWFSSTNPYWSRLVYMLKRLITNSNGKNYSSILDSSVFGSFSYNSSNSSYAPSLRNPINWIPFNYFIEDVRKEFRNGEFDNITFNTKIPTTIKLDGVNSTKNYVILAGGFYINVAFRLKDENGNVVYTTTPTCLHDDNTTVFEGNGVSVSGIPKITNGKYEFNFETNLSMNIERNVVGNDFSIECAVYTTDLYDRTDETILYDCDSISGGDISRVLPNIISIENAQTKIAIIASNNKHSYSKFTLNDLWDNEFNLFNEILDYCKMFRIGVFCDSINKKLLFKPLSTYFKEYKVLDWTDKLDMSREYQIKPITFENKYLLFNYNGIDTKLNKDYTEKYGVRYGEYKLTTDYEFNTETKKLYDGIYNSIPSSDTVLSWSKIYNELSIVYTIPAEILPNNKDKDNKCMDLFGSIFIYNGLSIWDTDSGLRNVKLTDDTTLQTINNLYFYTQDSEGDKNRISVETYPLLDIKGDNINICTFTTPSENYTYKKDNYDNAMGIYKNFWENYLNERYNKQNKIVTCYLRLTPYDIANFKYNNFVKIENQLYFVNKIYDYCIDENVATKVDLITIQDIEGYTKNNFAEEYILKIYDRDYNDLGESTLLTFEYVGQKKTIYVTSTSECRWYLNNAGKVKINGSTANEGSFEKGYRIPFEIECLADVDSTTQIDFTNNFEWKSVQINTELIDGFVVVKENGDVYKPNSDRIEFSIDKNGVITPQKYTLYVYSSTPVSWDDAGEPLLGEDFRLNQDRGDGVIPAGLPTEVDIWFEDITESKQGSGIKLTSGDKTMFIPIEAYTIGF